MISIKGSCDHDNFIFERTLVKYKDNLNNLCRKIFGGGYPQSLICGERYFDQNLYYDLRDASDSLDIITSRLQFTIMEI